MSLQGQFLKNLQREIPTTMKVLKSFPKEKAGFQPHEKSQTAKRLAWNLIQGPVAIQQAINDTFTIPPNFPAEPEDWGSVIAAFETESARAIRALEESKESQLTGSVPFFTGPGKMQNVDKMDFLWFVLFDNIHHRGQLTVYLRLAGGKVPSIYGPSADEPWF